MDPMTAAIRDALTHSPHILVVCTGNICRSPMGEIVLADRLAAAGLDLQVTSAGISDEEEGAPIHPGTRAILTDNGFDVPRGEAHRVTDAELTSAGLILAMTRAHAHALGRRATAVGADLERIHLWREFDGSGLQPASAGCFGPDGVLASGVDDRVRFADGPASSSDADVPDPWYSGDFEATYATVVAGAEGITRWLTERR